MMIVTNIILSKAKRFLMSLIFKKKLTSVNNMNDSFRSNNSHMKVLYPEMDNISLKVVK